MNCLTTAGTILLFVLIGVGFVVGFFVGKRHGVNVVAKLMKEKGQIIGNYKDIVNQVKNLKKRL